MRYGIALIGVFYPCQKAQSIVKRFVDTFNISKLVQEFYFQQHDLLNLAFEMEKNVQGPQARSKVSKFYQQLARQDIHFSVFGLYTVNYRFLISVSFLCVLEVLKFKRNFLRLWQQLFRIKSSWFR